MNRNNLLRQMHFKNKNTINNNSMIDTNTENKCNFVSSRGILKSCDIKSSYPISTVKQLLNYDFSKIEKNSTIYICSSVINEFIEKIFNNIHVPFILVTGDSDRTIPDDVLQGDKFINFIENDKIIHWFSQNCIGDHPKLSSIPIGLDYHTLGIRNENSSHEWGEMINAEEQEKQLIKIKNETKPFWERIIKGYSNFHFQLENKYCYDRKDAIKYIKKDLIFYEPNTIKRLDSWKNQSEYAFVISPHGNGLDCHRTWEALCLGCIVIVKTSKLDILYQDLPVLIVNDWKDVSIELLKRTVEEFKEKDKNGEFNYNKLNLNYWIAKINKKK